MSFFVLATLGGRSLNRFMESVKLNQRSVENLRFGGLILISRWVHTFSLLWSVLIFIFFVFFVAWPCFSFYRILLFISFIFGVKGQGNLWIRHLFLYEQPRRYVRVGGRGGGNLCFLFKFVSMISCFVLIIIWVDLFVLDIGRWRRRRRIIFLL